MNIRLTHTSRYHQRGVSMAELMIAMLLGIILMAGVLQLFSSNKSTFISMEGISEIQDGARAGIERVKSRVRMASYMGCSNVNAINPNNVAAGVAAVAFGPNNVVNGVDNDAAVNAIVDGTDTLTVVFATAANTALVTDMTSTADVITITTNPNNFQKNNALIITDCENADVFGASAVVDTGTGGPFTIAHATADATDTFNAVNTLSKPYLASNSLIMRLSSATYSVQNTGRFDAAGNPVRALFETLPGPGGPTEIITGVEDMQIEYGEDTSGDGNADTYVDASSVGSWSGVVSARITLLIATEREIGPNPRPYTDLAGNPQSDRHMRRTFTTTIGLRNRSF
jgi:type IV pilus assembly protein PilW